MRLKLFADISLIIMLKLAHLASFQFVTNEDTQLTKHYASWRQVGGLTARLLDWLHEAAGMNAAGVQVVGHSLGAHVSGVVGQNLKNFRLPFITG